MPCIKYPMFPPDTSRCLCFLPTVGFLHSVLLCALSKPFSQAANLKEVTLGSNTTSSIQVTLKRSKALNERKVEVWDPAFLQLCFDGEGYCDPQLAGAGGAPKLWLAEAKCHPSLGSARKQMLPQPHQTQTGK